MVNRSLPPGAYSDRNMRPAIGIDLGPPDGDRGCFRCPECQQVVTLPRVLLDGMEVHACGRARRVVVRGRELRVEGVRELHDPA